MSSDTLTASMPSIEDLITTIPEAEVAQAEENGRTLVRSAKGPMRMVAFD
ncbi:hypothetical protein ACTXMA_14820 [Corynebacterium variabile]